MYNKNFAHYRFDSQFIRFYSFFIQIISFMMDKMVPGLAKAMNFRIIFS